MRVLPDDEVGVSVGHDVFLRPDVLLLPRVHDMALLQDLHGKGLGLLVLQLHLRTPER